MRGDSRAEHGNGLAVGSSAPAAYIGIFVINAVYIGFNIVSYGRYHYVDVYVAPRIIVLARGKSVVDVESYDVSIIRSACVSVIGGIENHSFVRERSRAEVIPSDAVYRHTVQHIAFRRVENVIDISVMFRNLVFPRIVKRKILRGLSASVG